MTNALTIQYTADALKQSIDAYSKQIELLDGLETLENRALLVDLMANNLTALKMTHTMLVQLAHDTDTAGNSIDDYVTLDQYAKRHKISRRTVDRYISAGKLTAVKMFSRTLIHKDAKPRE